MSMRIAAADYEPLKAFFAWMADRVLEIPPGLAPEDRPLGSLERTEARSMASARSGLASAIGDIVELTEGISAKDLSAFDEALIAEGLPSLSAVRARFGRAVAAIFRRGEIRSEDEYYALRNVAELLPEEEQTMAWNLLARFENGISPDKDPVHGP